MVKVIALPACGLAHTHLLVLRMGTATTVVTVVRCQLLHKAAMRLHILLKVTPAKVPAQNRPQISIWCLVAGHAARRLE